MEEQDYTRYVAGLEARRQVTSRGVPYWTARDLMALLSYVDWRHFRAVIEKAVTACEKSGASPINHFVQTDEMVLIGSGAKREREDFYLSRYACYLIAMNAESSKPEVACAMTYFAGQTRRQEVQDQLTEAERRMELRDRVKDANRALNSAAKSAGVQKYGVFHDAGYRGLYGGIGVQHIKAKKGIPEKEDLLDCINRAELAANEFRITQAEQKLQREHVRGEESAVQTHKQVGMEVRATIRKLGGTMPEDLPAAPSLKRLPGKRAKALPKAPTDETPPAT